MWDVWTGGDDGMLWPWLNLRCENLTIPEATFQRPRKGKLMGGFSQPSQVGIECQDSCCAPRPSARTLDAWMPKKVDLDLSNSFKVFQVDAVDEEEEEDIGNVEDINGIVRVTIDSGAARSVWPMRKGGVTRRKIQKAPKLAAANGTMIEVRGEATLGI